MSATKSRVALKSIEISKRLSEETICFTASLYIDGVKVGAVKNRGCGGPMEYDDWDVVPKLDEIAKAELPVRKYRDMEMIPNNETLINELLTQYQVMEQAKDLFKGHFVGLVKVEIYSAKVSDKKMLEETLVDPAKQEAIRASLKFDKLFTSVNELYDHLLADSKKRFDEA